MTVDFTSKPVLDQNDDLWENESVKMLIKKTNPEDLYRYQKTTSTVMSNAVSEDPTKNIVDAAFQVRLSLRDGLPIEMLSDDEKRLFIYVYGEEGFDDFRY